ncbi:hypothetical protein Hdeb2414_s0176g00823651 [Helianthus debilis subsp. tardiflorus]
MAKFITNSLLTLTTVVLLLIAPSVIDGSEAPFIVAHKKATLNRLKSGADKLSVSIDIYNRGSAYATISILSIQHLHACVDLYFIRVILYRFIYLNRLFQLTQFTLHVIDSGFGD